MTKNAHVRNERLDSYANRFAEHVVLERADGVLTARIHTDGQEAVWSLELHRALGQLFGVISEDPDNEVLVLTGTGRYWLRGWDQESFDAVDGTDDVFRRRGFRSWYHDGRRLLENLVSALDIPTIGVFNGPGVHAEIPLLCDLTICADDARIVDPHLSIGLVPGDGMFLVLQHLLGPKRANRLVYLAEQVSAAQALEWGLVNEVLPRDQLQARALELAAGMLEIDPVVRRVTTQVVRRPWRRLLVDDFEHHFAHEMWGALVNRKPHGRG